MDKNISYLTRFVPSIQYEAILIAELFGEELQCIRTTQPCENITQYPEETELSEDNPTSPDVEATSVPKWLVR